MDSCLCARYCPRCNSTESCGCDSVVDSRRQSSRGGFFFASVTDATDDGEEAVDQELKVGELYIDYKDFIRVIKFRLEMMEVGTSGTGRRKYFRALMPITSIACCLSSHTHRPASLHHSLRAFCYAHSLVCNKQKILKDRELELLTDANSKVKHYQCPDKDCGAQYNRIIDVFDQIMDSKVDASSFDGSSHAYTMIGRAWHHPHVGGGVGNGGGSCIDRGVGSGGGGCIDRCVGSGGGGSIDRGVGSGGGAAL